MSGVRERLKSLLPPAINGALAKARVRLTTPPPIEASALHAYRVDHDAETRPRLTLIIPSIAPDIAFGGIVTGLDIFLRIGRCTGADLRVVLDVFGPVGDRSVLDKQAGKLGLDPNRITVVPRLGITPRLEVRSSDVFFTYNTWSTLNLRPVLVNQSSHFETPLQPYIQIIQDYEPQFYPFSSSHLLALEGFDRHTPKWCIINTRELYDYFVAHGHRPDRTYVFEPKISDALRPHLAARPEKSRRIMVYGRPGIPRNCFPAILAGLRAWTRRYQEFGSWEVVSAGVPHRPEPLGGGRVMRSVGKLSLDDYAAFLGRTAVGLSLMASPHPSYPPIEMAHFGVLTITNRYANKDLSTTHDNILSIADVSADTIADALAEACRRFEAAPLAGWTAKSHRASFTQAEAYPFVDEISRALMREVWGGA